MKQLKIFTAEELTSLHLSIVREIGSVIGVKSSTSLSKEELVETIIKIQNKEILPTTPNKKGAPKKIKIDLTPYYVEDDELLAKRSLDFADNPVETEEFIEAEGVLEQHVSGYGFLRVNNYENSKEDIYVSMQNIRKYNLRRGDKVRALAKPSKDSSPALQEVLRINDLDPTLFLKRENFDNLIPYYPTDRLNLEIEGDDDLAIRCIDLFSPIGLGQRGLIVAPPKAGKTTLLKKIAKAIETNHPEVKLMVLLIDERPEEVTDIKRSVKGEVIYSTFDENPEHHIRAAELVINRAKRLVEVNKNVVILMDSITKLTRAYNNTVQSSGKTLSGGIDPVALFMPKKFFGTARNIEKGGSLTILSTALVETGSRMDDVIYEEFKGTGNMEIHLSRELSERRVFPAIDLYKSGTRREELLLSKEELDTVYKLRKILSERNDATDSLLEMMKKSKNNKDLIAKLDTWIELYKK
ncbi:MAG: transcription termination factor Rho [Clostridiales bacterium]|nr:transcription termination factor Rho [Clostridiales bacterium]